jgi:hypothetical protein
MSDNAIPAISITPPLTFEEMKSFGDFRVVYCVRAEAGGAGELAPREGMNYRPNFIQEHLQTIIDHFPTHEFTGYVEYRNMSEDHQPVARYHVRDRRVVTVTPMLVWPGNQVGQGPLVADARAIAVMCRDILDSMPVGLDEFFEGVWDDLPNWFTRNHNGREIWGGA